MRNSSGWWRTVESGHHGWSSGPSTRPVSPSSTRRRTRDHLRTASAACGRLFDQLIGPDGLTEHASTFTRPDVLVALGAGLAGARRTELEELADRFLAERAVSVVADRTLESAAGPPPSSLPSSSGW
jgi:hypothetical protein